MGSPLGSGGGLIFSGFLKLSCGMMHFCPHVRHLAPAGVLAVESDQRAAVWAVEFDSHTNRSWICKMEVGPLFSLAFPNRCRCMLTPRHPVPCGKQFRPFPARTIPSTYLEKQKWNVHFSFPVSAFQLDPIQSRCMQSTKALRSFVHFWASSRSICSSLTRMDRCFSRVIIFSSGLSRVLVCSCE